MVRRAVVALAVFVFVLSGADARAQARKASSRVGVLKKGHLPLALDLETDSTSLGKADLTKWAITWLKVVETRDRTCADCPEEAF